MQDETVLEKLCNNETAALEYVMHQYGKLLWLVIENIIGRVGTTEDIEECLNDVFIRFWKKPHKFNPKKGTLKVFLCVMARSTALTRYKVLSRQKAVKLEEHYLTKEDNLAELICNKDMKGQLVKKVSEMKEPDKEIFIRRYFLGEKPARIAQTMLLDEKAVTNRLYQSKQKLKNEFKEVRQL